MARTVLPFVGAAIGFWVGGPTGAQVGFALGGVVGNAVDPVKNIGPKIGETGAQTSAEGAPRAIVYGTASVTGNVIAAGPLIKAEVEEEGGKGGPVNVTERAYRFYAIRICEGPIAGILRIWEDDKLVYDMRVTSTMIAESTQWLGANVIYLGDESQTPDVFMTTNIHEDNPAYRGTAYMSFNFRDLTDRRGSIPQYRFEVSGSSSIIELPRIESNNGFIASNGGGRSTVDLEINEFSVNSHIQPLNLVTIYCRPVGLNPICPMRWQLVVDGVVLLDTGWSGDPSDEAMLNAFLADIGRSDLTGTMTATQDFVEEVHMLRDSVEAKLLLYTANPDPINFKYFDAQASSIYPDPDEAPADYIPYSVPGVGISPSTGFIFSASWGPDMIEVIGGDGSGDILGDIVSDIHARCDVPSVGYDVSELDDLVYGLVLAGDYTGADAINTLRGPYFFDKAEANGKLWYPKRGAAVVDTLTIDDLIDEPDTQMREQAIEYPRKFHLFYQHANSGYAVVKATSQRSSPDVRVVGEATAQVPVVINEDQAAQAAHKMHKVSWAEAEGEVKFSIPWSFIARVPSNPIGLSLRGRVNRLRITDMALADGVIDVTCRHDRQSAYTSNVTGVPIPNPTPPPATIIGATQLVVLDIPSLRDEEDDLNIYYAVTGTQPAWHGAVVQRSSDGGSTWTSVETITNAQVVGELVESLADADADITDTTNSVTVRLFRAGQTLESISDTAFLSEGGAFAIKNQDGQIEILQARDWMQDSNGDWVGSMLHRGRLNTVTNAHAAGSIFVMLDRVRHSPMPSALIGQSVSYRAPSLGQPPEDAMVQAEIYNGNSQIEWPPASLVLARDGADIITASWVPRHRFGTDDNPIASLNFQGYRITIADGIAPAVVIEQTANSLTYDASALASPVDIIVQSMNRITGAGSATSGTI